MKTKFNLILTLILAFAVQQTFAQQKTITGTVTDGQSGMPLAGVNIVVEGTQNGAQTDFDGNYSIEASPGQVLVFSYVGYADVKKTVGSETTINVTMKQGTSLDKVVITALGIKREKKSLTYAAQSIDAEDLNIAQVSNVKSALAGKIAGIEFNAQAGSKLGQSGDINIRGMISLTNSGDPLYVVNGIPTDSPNAINMSNVATVTVLKGPTASALYGQRAANGVIQITTKTAEEGESLSISLNSTFTIDNITNLRDYQNLYGKGYSGGLGNEPNEFAIFDFSAGSRVTGTPYPDFYQVFDGKRYFKGLSYADESWGERFDGEPYLPWYSLYKTSPYFGQTFPYVAHPDNIKEFFRTAETYKNTVSIASAGENYSGRVSWTNLEQKGIIPYSSLHKNFFSASFDIDLTDNFTIGMRANYAEERIKGSFDDGYSNPISGAFNQWFNRGLNFKKLKELQGLKTMGGWLASWNNWGLDAMGPAIQGVIPKGYNKAAFWFNPYDVVKYNIDIARRTDLLANIHGSYNFLDHYTVSFQISRNQGFFKDVFRVPAIIERSSAPQLYNVNMNSFGNYIQRTTEDNYSLKLRYENDFGDFDLNAMVGGNIRKNDYYRFSAWMDQGLPTGGLILPDVYTYANSRERIVPIKINRQKQVNSLYASASLGYNDYLFLDASYRQDWSSALPTENNGYGYPGVGLSFVFTEFIESDFISYGKFRASYAEVGDDVGALAINPTLPLGNSLYNGNALLFTRRTKVDPNIKPARNSSYEIGLDLRFFDSNLTLNATYYHEVREDEIIPISISAGTGYEQLLTNAGKTKREGVELTLTTNIFDTKDFTWNIVGNIAVNKSVVVNLPKGLETVDINYPGLATVAFGPVSYLQKEGMEMGQLIGNGFVYKNGQRVINPDGTYAYQPGQFFGSVLPDFTGGLVNTFRYKNLSLTAQFQFQKGGHFFSLSEYWGYYTGLFAATAKINDKGNNVRVPVAQGGGVHVTGVDPQGNPVDTYVEAQTYFKQFRGHNIGEQYVHDASFIKLNTVSLSYRLPKSVLGNFFNSASISVIGRNLWLIAVADENRQHWDPSQMSQPWGENGQLPSTRSFGVNLNLTF